MILAQIEVDPELARRLGLICQLTFAWGGWLLLLLAGLVYFGRRPSHRPAGWLVLGIVLPLSLPALLAAPSVLSATEKLSHLNSAALLCVQGYEGIFIILSVTWGTLLYMRGVRQWSGFAE